VKPCHNLTVSSSYRDRAVPKFNGTHIENFKDFSCTYFGVNLEMEIKIFGHLSHALAGSCVVRPAKLREPTRIFQKPLDSCFPLLCLGGVRDAETVGLWGWLLPQII
jgi:hypothetical protein